jgi:hypothetical protein
MDYFHLTTSLTPLKAGEPSTLVSEPNCGISLVCMIPGQPFLVFLAYRHCPSREVGCTFIGAKS